MTVVFNNGAMRAVHHAPGLADGELASFVSGADDGFAELAYHIDPRAPAEMRNAGLLEIDGVEGRWSVYQILNAQFSAGVRVLKLERASDG